MCLGIPAQVVDVPDPTRATVSIGGVNRLISTELLDGGAKEGDWVLVHVGFALSTIDADEAHTTLQQIRQLGANTFDDELDSFRTSEIE